MKLDTNMSKETVNRLNRTDKTEIDLTKPVDVDSIEKDGSCFGEEWEARDNYCQICADSELCSILYAAKVKKMEEAIKKEGEKFLDSSDFEGVDKMDLSIWLGAKERTAEEFLEYIMEQANTIDEEAAYLYVVRYVKKHKHISIKDGKIIINKKK